MTRYMHTAVEPLRRQRKTGYINRRNEMHCYKHNRLRIARTFSLSGANMDFVVEIQFISHTAIRVALVTYAVCLTQVYGTSLFRPQLPSHSKTPRVRIDYLPSKSCSLRKINSPQRRYVRLEVHEYIKLCQEHVTR